MANGQNSYYMDFLIRQYGKENLDSVGRSVLDASKNIKQADIDTKVWLTNLARSSGDANIKIKDLAAGLKQVTRNLQESEQAGAKLEQVLGRVGGRIGGAELLGRAAGIPGGGFIGSQLIQGLGLTGGTALAVGGAAVGAAALYGSVQALEGISKYAEQQRNLAAATGLTVEQTQLYGRVAEVAGVKAEALYGTTKRLAESMANGGTEATRTARALRELGLSAGVAFEDPNRQLTDILGALRKVGTEAERFRLIKNLGLDPTQLLPLVDTFNAISAAVQKSGVIMGGDVITAFTKFQEQSKEAGLAWDNFKNKLAQKALAVVEFVSGGDIPNLGRNIFRGFGGGSAGVFFEDDARMAASRAVTTGDSESRSGHYGAIRLGQLKEATLEPRDRIESLRDTIADLQDQAKSAYSKYAGPKGQPADLDQYKSLEEQIESTRKKIKAEQEYIKELEKVTELTKRSTEDAARHFFGNTPLGRTAYGVTRLQEEQADALRKAPPSLRGRILGAYGTQIGAAQGDYAREIQDYQKKVLGQNLEGEDIGIAAQKKYETTERKDLKEILTQFPFLKTPDVPPTMAGYSSPEQSLRDAQRTGREAISLFDVASRGGDLTTSQKISGEFTIRLATAQKEFEAETRISELKKTEEDKAISREDALDKLRQAKFDAEIDRQKSLIEAANRQKEEFRGLFEGIVLGAQSSGGKGVLGAVRGFGEKQEAKVLGNIFDHYFSKIVVDISHQIGGVLPPWLTKGTVFEDPTKDIKTSREDLDRIKEILEGWNGKGGSGGSGSGGSSGISAGSPAGTGIPAALRALGLGGGGGALSGIDSNNSMILHGFPGSGTGASGPGGPVNPLSVRGIPTDVTAGFLAYQGIKDVSSGGGAKRTAGGVSEILGAAALVDPEPISKIALAASAVVAGIVSSLLGDTKQQRGDQISKQIFTSQYLAPQAINTSVGGNGGFADTDIYGNVRESALSPYPVVSNSYLDVPRRTVVPGHNESTFGGYSGTPSAGVYPTNPRQIPPVQININAMDAKSIVDRADDIGDAVHAAISRGHPALVSTLSQHLGLRG